MSRGPRQAPGGIAYHALNRAVARLPLFEKPADSDAFVRVLAEALAEYTMRVLPYCLMPNHWHFVLGPEADGQLSAFCRWLAHTHSMRWHAHYHTSGTGHFSISDRTATLPTNYTFTAADAGVHTFTNAAILKKKGTQTLTVTDTKNSALTATDSIDVV